MDYDFGFWNSEVPAKVLEIRESYVNSLSPNEIKKIKELRSRMHDVLKPEHTDYYMIKWLNARKFDVSAAENMLRAHLKFREEFRVDYIQNEYTPREEISKYVTQGVCGEDREGSPVYIFPGGKFDIVGCLHSTSPAELRDFIIFHFEYSQVLNRKSTLKHEKVISSEIAICDLEDVRIKDFMWKPALELIFLIIKILEADYPGCLKKGFIINAPKMFTVLWALIKPLLSDETKKKVCIFGKDNWKEALLEMIHPDQLPKHWGGNLVGTDGNPYFSPMICMGGKVPEKNYRSIEKLQNSLKSTSVERKGKFILDIKIDKAKSFLTWSFHIEDYDIDFGVIYKPNENEEIEVIPLVRFKSHFVPEDGRLICEDTGNYCIVFDNSYSWYRSKKIYYEFKVIEP